MDVQVRLLGPLEIVREGRAIDLGGRRQQCLLAVLLLELGRPVHREQIARWAWPDDPPPSVASLIASYISRLRRALDPAGDALRLVATHPGFAAHADPGLLDLRRFRELHRQARVDLAEGRTASGRHALEKGLGLWSGELVYGLDTEFIAQHRRVAEGERVGALELLARLDFEAGRPERAAELLAPLMEADSSNEAVAALLVRALAATGRAAQATALALSVTRTVHAEGRTPSLPLREAHREALAGGSRSQVGLSPTGSQPRNSLPIASRVFTGRSRELEKMRRIARGESEGDVSRSTTVVITAIDGMPGIGKTALAVQMAHLEGARYPGGQVFIDLRGFTSGLEPLSADAAVSQLLVELGVPAAQIPGHPADRAALYRSVMARRKMLLVFDNAASTAQVRPLITSGAGSLILVTSRRRLLDLDEAHTVTLGVMPRADAAALLQAVAGSERLDLGHPDVAQLLDLCGRVPLAIRIAASHLRHHPALGPEQVVEQLSAQHRRLVWLHDEQHGFNAVFDASYTHLSDEERALFDVLGLVPGTDFDTDAAANLLDTPLERARDLLDALLEHNLLIQRTAERYRFHDLVRAYARTRIPENGPVALAARERLWNFYIHTAHRANLLTTGTSFAAPGRPRTPLRSRPLATAHHALAWLVAEQENLDAAAHFAVSNDAPAYSHALPRILNPLWRPGGIWHSALILYQASLLAEMAATGALVDPALAPMLRIQDVEDIEAVKALYLKALAFHEACDNRLGRASSQLVGGSISQLTGDYATAARMLTSSAVLYREQEHLRGYGLALLALGAGQRITGSTAQAVMTLTEALTVWRTVGDQAGELSALVQCGIAYCDQGDYAQAEATLITALAAHRAQAKLVDIAGDLAHLGRLHTMTGDHATARLELTEARTLFAQAGDGPGQATALNFLGALATRETRPTQAREHHQAALALACECASPWDEANAHLGLSRIASIEGDERQASAHRLASEAILRCMQYPEP